MKLPSTMAARNTFFLALLAQAHAAPTTVKASAFAASPATVIPFPPSGTAANPSLFPPESVVGDAGPTPTGAEPDAIQTAKAYPYNSGAAAHFPLVAPQPFGSGAESPDFDITKYWGNLSPWYSVQSSDYGLPDANPLIPDGCEITQVHLLYRHGARYPSGSGVASFADKIKNATNKGNLAFSGELSFLSSWQYQLGQELLTPFGRSQNFMLGIEHRQLYGKLLNNFTAAGKIPVFRTESQDRMVKTANNFAAGFFGIPEYLHQVNIEIVPEVDAFNNSGAPYEICTNSNVDSRAYMGSAAASKFAATAFNGTLARFNSEATGIKFDSADIINMLQLCAYETVALGYSSFCELFSEEDWINFEYYYDISFYYNNGPGSPVSAAQGKGYLDEFLARATGKYPQPNSSLNATYDDSPVTFPLDQPIYADATHEVVVLDTLIAYNLTGLFRGPPLDPKENLRQSSFVASKVVPFATHFTTQVLCCPAKSPQKQIRFLLNDAVIPIDQSYPGCSADKDGLCSFDNVISVLQKRSAEIDFDYDCFANYTAQVGVDYNGRAPRS